MRPVRLPARTSFLLIPLLIALVHLHLAAIAAPVAAQQPAQPNRVLIREAGVSIDLPAGWRNAGQAQQGVNLYTPGGVQSNRQMAIQFVPAPGGNNQNTNLSEFLQTLLQQNAANIPGARVESNTSVPVTNGSIQLLVGTFNNSQNRLILMAAAPTRMQQVVWLVFYNAPAADARTEEDAIMASFRSVNMNVDAAGPGPGPGPGTTPQRFDSPDFGFSITLPAGYVAHALQQQNAIGFWPDNQPRVSNRILFFRMPFAPAAQAGATTMDEYTTWWLNDQQRKLTGFALQQRGNLECQSGSLVIVVFQFRANNGTDAWRVIHGMQKVGDHVYMFSCQALADSFEPNRAAFERALASVAIGSSSTPGPGPGPEPDPVPADSSAREMLVAASDSLAGPWAALGGRVLARHAPGVRLKLTAAESPEAVLQELADGNVAAALVESTIDGPDFARLVEQTVPGGRAIPLGTRALAIVAADGCPVSRVPLAALKALLSGAADAPATFGDLDPESCAGTPWANRKLRLLLPPEHSAVSRWIDAWLNDGSPVAAGVERARGELALATAARSDKSVLALCDSGWIGPGTVALPVAAGTEPPSRPTAAEVMSGEYPLAARLMLVLPEDASADAQALARALLDPRGQAFAGDPNRCWAPLDPDQLAASRERIAR